MTNLNERTLIDEVDFHTENWALETIGAKGFKRANIQGDLVRVLSIDTGVKYNHRDLKFPYQYGYNHFTKHSNPYDDNGHGTHVGGLIAGAWTGVNPNCALYSAKVLDDNGRGGYRGFMDAITFGIQFGVDIINISLGTNTELPPLVTDKIREAHDKGIILVCATGNTGSNHLVLPASMDEVIAVGGIGTDLKRASFSNYGKGIDCVAPAVDVLSTYHNGKYALMSGTSMASPLVASGISLLVSYHKKQTGIKVDVSMIRQLLSEMNDEPYNEEVGHGVFDLRKFLKNV